VQDVCDARRGGHEPDAQAALWRDGPVLLQVDVLLWADGPEHVPDDFVDALEVSPGAWLGVSLEGGAER